MKKKHATNTNGIQGRVPSKPEKTVLRQNVASHNVYVTKRNCY